MLACFSSHACGVQAENIVITHRRYLPGLLLTVATLLGPTTAEAGPLFDWLFQRNRSQAIGGYNNNSTYYRGPVAAGQPQPAGRSCLTNLFGRNQRGANSNPLAPSNGYAAAPNVYGQTAGYAPQAGGCAAGWCQQTVVRWIPQTAYRTAYQQVPVTTYKTSTTINPANGLPLTCTRPCTTYSTQARRVPYTTYRPIYTTVPVSDPLAQQQAPLARPAVAGYPPATAAPAYALQPPTAATYGAPAGCANCQTGAANSNYGSWSNVPGYTPGSASRLPPAVAPRPWADEATGGRNPAGATDWRTVPGNGDPYAAIGRDAPWQTSPGQGSSSSGATDWRTVGPSGTTQPPSSRGSEPANQVPRLNRPIYPDEYNYGDSRNDTMVPDYLRRRISGESQGQLVPRESTDSSYRNDPRTSNYASDRGYFDRSYSDRSGYNSRYDNEQNSRSSSSHDDLYGSPRDDDYARSGSPDLTAPSNQADTPNSQRPIRGIPDRRRQQPANLDSELDFNDRTAGQQRRPQGTRPVIEETRQTRYVEWENRASSDRDRSQFDWRKQAARPRHDVRPVSAWTPIR